MYEDAGDRDDRLSKGKTLTLPNPPWGVKQPGPVFHYTGTVPERESTRPIAALAAQLSAEMLDTMPEDLRQAAADAYAASQETNAALNMAQAELAAMNGPAPAGLSVDELSARRMRRLGLEDHIAALRSANADANKQAEKALDAARHRIVYYTGRSIHAAARARAHQMREEADRLIEEAGRLDIAALNALSKVNAWVPTEQAAPAVEPPATPAPKRRKLFGGA